MVRYKNIQITKHFLDNNSDSYFVFGDNLIGQGYGGAAVLRDHPQAIGFITKQFPDNRDTSFYTPSEYEHVFWDEFSKLEARILSEPDKMFYISQLGGGLANRYHIWDVIIKPNIVPKLQNYNNVVFCWEE